MLRQMRVGVSPEILSSEVEYPGAAYCVQVTKEMIGSA
jgi:hypothetical protein